MSLKLLKGISILLAMIGGIGSFGHHEPFSDMDLNDPISIEGRITRMEWINPHGILHVETLNEFGVAENWAVQVASPNGLLRQGVSRNTTQTGDIVTVELFRSLGTPCTNECFGYGLRLVDQAGRRYTISPEIASSLGALRLGQ
ncbi:MAG: DUF6152 family protein [Pseudohongiellaceae bacterium]